MQTSIAPFTSHRLASLGLICACLIVASHSGFVCTDSGIGGAKWWLSRFLSQVGGIAVPFFFLTAAYFLAGHVGERGWWGRETRKRVSRSCSPSSSGPRSGHSTSSWSPPGSGW